MPDASSDSSTMVAVALANVFALTAAVFMAANISGGHVNPAVTFGMAVGGHVSVPTALFYWTSQLLAATMACSLLKLTTIQQVIINRQTFGVSLGKSYVTKTVPRHFDNMFFLLFTFVVCPNSCYSRRHDRLRSFDTGSGSHVRLGLRGLRCGRHETWFVWVHGRSRGWVHSRSRGSCGFSFLWRVDEPGLLLWICCCCRHVQEPSGLLGRSLDWSRCCKHCVRLCRVSISSGRHDKGSEG